VRFKATSLLSALLIILGLGAVPASGARADVDTSLPITSFGQIVADTAHGHAYLFISQASGGTILVTDLDGNTVTTISGQHGLAGMALSADGGTLYAALATDHAVSAISVATLKETARYSLGAGNTPAGLAVQRGKIWVSYTDSNPVNPGAIGEIDPGAATPFTAGALPGAWLLAPQIAADPADSGVVVANLPGRGEAVVASYDVSTDPVTVYAQPTDLGGCAGDLESGNLAVIPGGASFLLPCLTDPVYDTKTLSQSANPYAGGLLLDFAMAPTGTVAMGNNAVLPGQPDVFTYPQGGGAAQGSYVLETNAGRSLAFGLHHFAWSADGSELFVVLETDSALVSVPTTYALHVLYPPKISTAITLRYASAPIGQQFTLVGTFSAGGGAQTVGVPVTVTRTGPGGAVKRLAATTTAGGIFKITDVLTAMGTYRYTASYAGTSTTAPATSTPPITLTAYKNRPVLRVSVSPSPVSYQARVTVTAHLGPTSDSRVVSIYAQPAGGSRRLLKAGPVNSTGNLSLTQVLTRNTTYIVTFAGDARDVPVIAAVLAGVRARVSEAISGYYGTERLGGITYRLYHRTAKLLAAIAVTPNKHGQCFELEAQDDGHGWEPNATTGCGHLNSASKGTGFLTLTKASLGVPYRVRADFIESTKDTSNVNGDSGWLYFIVEK
jgi:hypothetical protein